MEEGVEDDMITVKKVCQDFRVREDGALASRLQEEEFQKHYIRNKSERKTVRSDVRVAKKTYLEEVRTAHLLPEDELQDMEETDRWLAKDLQDKLHSEERREIERQAKIASRDAKMAQTIQEREKEKFDREWHRRREEERLGREQQEREHRDMEGQNVARQTDLEMKDAQLAKDLQEREKQRYERERQRRKEIERERMHRPEMDENERLRYEKERQRRREKERERFDGPEIDRQRELELRDARIAKDLQEREKQKFDREWQRRREREIMEEQERRHYQRSASEPNERERDARRSATRPLEDDITVNGHSAEPVIQRRNRPGSGREGRRRSTGSGSSAGSGGSGGKDERRPNYDQDSGRRGGNERRDERRPNYDQDSSRRGGSDRRDERRPNYDQDSGRRGGSDRGDEREPKQERPRGREDDRKRAELGGSGANVGKDERKPKRDQEEKTAVALPTAGNGGGRLEHDRIILADGTEIHLFENDEEKQKNIQNDRHIDKKTDKQKDKQKEETKDLELERVKKDEEYAKMLQDQERRIVEAEKMAAEDKRLAMEEQDRELARHLQRKEYHRMQQERKERQMRRANSVPSDRLSVNLQDPRRLPSYQEALHRHQMPDLLPDSHESDCNRYSYVSTNSYGGTGSHPSSLERETNLAHLERTKNFTGHEIGPRAGTERLTARGPQQPSERRKTEFSDEMLPSHGNVREDRHKLRHMDDRSDIPPPQVFTIEDRDDERLRDHGSLRDERDVIYLPRDDGRSRDRPEERQPSPAEYERLVPEQEPVTNRDNANEQIWLTKDPEHISPVTSLERSYNTDANRETVRSSYASSGHSSYDRRSHTSGYSGSPPSREDVWERLEDIEDEERENPTDHGSEQQTSYNVVEGIDPTFRRKPMSPNDDPKDLNSDERAKVIHLIKPHRRRSTEKKKDQKKTKKNI